MSLLESLKSKKRLERTVIVDGDTYEVHGLSLASKAKVYAQGRKPDGSLDSAATDAGFLSVCVKDPQTKARVADVDTWKSVPAHVSGPLLEVIAEVCGLRTEGTLDPKALDSIES